MLPRFVSAYDFKTYVDQFCLELLQILGIHLAKGKTKVAGIVTEKVHCGLYGDGVDLAEQCVYEAQILELKLGSARKVSIKATRTTAELYNSSTPFNR